jgi:hypothetical protein
MQEYVYSFQSAVGIFWIRPERDKSWGLYIGGEGIVELLGYYGSAFAAACTGPRFTEEIVPV